MFESAGRMEKSHASALLNFTSIASAFNCEAISSTEPTLFRTPEPPVPSYMECVNLLAYSCVELRQVFNRAYMLNLGVRAHKKDASTASCGFQGLRLVHTLVSPPSGYKGDTWSSLIIDLIDCIFDRTSPQLEVIYF